MATEVIMPKVDMVMETGTFVEWLKKEGEHVNKGDPIFVLMTEKAAIEAESPADGILAGLRAKPDDVIPVTEVIAYILAPGEVLPVKEQPNPVATFPAPLLAETAAVVVPESVGIDAVGSGNVRATPLARRLAQELQVDLAQISGRGPRGRIHKADVLAYQKTQTETDRQDIQAAGMSSTLPSQLVIPSISNTAGRIPLPDARRKQVIPLAGLRKIISERMSYSASTAPHFSVSLRADMTEVIRFREQVLEPLQVQTGKRVSYTAILALAVASVLPRHPYLNASISDDNIILWDDIHLGIATSVEEYLIVPVIKEVQNKRLGQIVTELADLTERARNRHLKPTEMTGSTFTISNLGMFGIESFTAIINPPESAILTVGKIMDTPVKNGDSIIFKPMIELTATVDHRMIDGVAAARFLDDLKSTLENPYLLIL
jgi:pyruvate dehydrogenase E2 component (dihydrolipoamide acetyltransferase)